MFDQASIDGSRLATVILTLNEADNIADAIDSVSKPQTPVIVVDSGSSDETVDIARERGATILVHRCDGPFQISAQRNWAVRRLRGVYDWLLFLDADERATPEFMAEIWESITSDRFDAYLAAPRFWYQGTWLKRFSGYPNWHPRLIRAGSVDAPFQGGTWETFHSELSSGHIAEPYEHYVNSKGFEDWVRRHLRYARAEATCGVERRRHLRKTALAAGSLRPFFSLAYFLLARRGILDGGSVGSYTRRRLIYELMIVEMLRQSERDESGLSR